MRRALALSGLAIQGRGKKKGAERVAAVRRVRGGCGPEELEAKRYPWSPVCSNHRWITVFSLFPIIFGALTLHGCFFLGDFAWLNGGCRWVAEAFCECVVRT